MTESANAHEWGHQPASAEDGSTAQARRILELLNEGAQLLHSRRPGEALQPLREASRLAPDDAGIAINLGGAYIMQHKYRQAVPVLERAARLEPHNPMVWVNLAAAYLGRLELSSRGMQDKAITAFEKALELDPQAPNVHYNLGLIYKERGETSHACAHFYRAVEVNPVDRDARSWLKRLQEPDEAGPAGRGDG